MNFFLCFCRFCSQKTPHRPVSFIPRIRYYLCRCVEFCSIPGLRLAIRLIDLTLCRSYKSFNQFSTYVKSGVDVFPSLLSSGSSFPSFCSPSFVMMSVDGSYRESEYEYHVAFEVEFHNSFHFTTNLRLGRI